MEAKTAVSFATGKNSLPSNLADGQLEGSKFLGRTEQFFFVSLTKVFLDISINFFFASKWIINFDNYM